MKEEARCMSLVPESAFGGFSTALDSSLLLQGVMKIVAGVPRRLTLFKNEKLNSCCWDF